MWKNCSSILVGVCILIWMTGGLVILGGFIQEGIENRGYFMGICTVYDNMICPSSMQFCQKQNYSGNGDFNVQIEMKYVADGIEFFKWILVYTCNTYQEAKNYVARRYQNGKLVPCYVIWLGNDIGIKLELYDAINTVIAGAVLFLISILISGIYLTIKLVQKWKRRHYNDLDEGEKVPL